MNTPTFEAMANDPVRILRKAQQLVADEYNKHRPDGAKVITPESVQVLDFTRGPIVAGFWTAMLNTELDDDSDRMYRVMYDSEHKRAYINTFRLERISCVYDSGDPTHNWSQQY